MPRVLKRLVDRDAPLWQYLVGPAAVLLVFRVISGHRQWRGFDAAVYYYGAARGFLRGVNPYKLSDVVSPPSALVLLAPLRAVSFDTAYIVLEIISAASLVYASYLLILRFLHRSRGEALTGGLVITALAAPSYSTTGLGNINGPLLLTLVLAYVASLDGDERKVGLWMGLGMALKPVLAPVWIVLLLQRRWKAAGWTFAVPGVLTVAAIAYNSKTIRFFDEGLKNAFTNLSNRFPDSDLSIGSFMRAVHASALTPVARLGVLVVVAVVCVWIWQTQNHATTDNEERTMQWLELGMTLFVGYMLASTFAWRYYSIYLLPLVVVAALRTSIARNVVVWAGVLLLMWPDDPGFINRSIPRVVPSNLSAIRQTGSVALILVGLGLAAYELRRNRLRADAG